MKDAKNRRSREESANAAFLQGEEWEPGTGRPLPRGRESQPARSSARDDEALRQITNLIDRMATDRHEAHRRSTPPEALIDELDALRIEIRLLRLTIAEEHAQREQRHRRRRESAARRLEELRDRWRTTHAVLGVMSGAMQGLGVRLGPAHSWTRGTREVSDLLGHAATLIAHYYLDGQADGEPSR